MKIIKYSTILIKNKVIGLIILKKKEMINKQIRKQKKTI